MLSAEEKMNRGSKMKIRNVQVIEVRDWNSFVNETYSKPYNFQQQDGCKSRGKYYIEVPNEPEDYENDSVPEVVNHNDMGVGFATWLARDPEQKLNSDDKWDRDYGLKLWWERNFYPHVSMIANDLHSKGLLPSGIYIIDIDW